MNELPELPTTEEAAMVVLCLSPTYPVIPNEHLREVTRNLLVRYAAGDPIVNGALGLEDDNG